MNDDAHLLRRYAEEGSEADFAELVQRHLSLVYHAALRQCGGDAHRAQDVAQKVFSDLARKAKSLTDRSSLTGWLYTSTRYAAAQAVRTEARRQAREQEAFRMNEVEAQHLEPATDWKALRLVIDEALHSLSERDRDAVLLRFFEGKGFAELGTELALSEDGARMRVERALEKLRTRLARHGITSTAGALGLTLSQQAGAALPAGLATTIAGTAITSATASGGGMAAGWLIFMSSNKASVSALVAIAGVALLNFGQQQANAKLSGEVHALAAESGRLEATRLALPAPVSVAPTVAASPADLAELTRLREQTEALRKKFADRAGSLRGGYIRVGDRTATRSTPPGEKIDVLFRDGSSSPSRSWQTLNAMGRALDQKDFQFHEWVDLDMLALMFCVDQPARARVDAFIRALPPEQRTGFASAERLLASVFNEWMWKGDWPQTFSTDRDDAYDPKDSTQAYTSQRITFNSGRSVIERYGFKRFDDGWRYGPLSVTDVEQMLALLDPRAGIPLRKQEAAR